MLVALIIASLIGYCTGITILWNGGPIWEALLSFFATSFGVIIAFVVVVMIRGRDCADMFTPDELRGESKEKAGGVSIQSKKGVEQISDHAL